MKILFIVFSELSQSNGIAKKIVAQVEGLRASGLEVDLCHYKNINGERFWSLNNSHFAKIGNGLKASLRHYYYYSPILRLIKKSDYDGIYLRYIHNATPWMLRFFSKARKQNIKIIMEIPTFPYDGEYKYNTFKEKIRFFIERNCRKHFKDYITKIATFSCDTEIFKIPTLNIANGVDVQSIPIINQYKKSKEIRFLAVANLSFWHGYDRLIRGLSDYYRKPCNRTVHFDLIGGGPLVETYKKMVSDFGLEKYVHFHGLQYGEKLNQFFQDASLCIGCLGCHRKNIFNVRSLKNIEYAVRGLPMVYSENNPDFDNAPYVIKVSPDEKNIDIDFLLHSLDNINISPIEIRNSVKHLDWKIQMKTIANEFQSV